MVRATIARVSRRLRMVRATTAKLVLWLSNLTKSRNILAFLNSRATLLKSIRK